MSAAASTSGLASSAPAGAGAAPASPSPSWLRRVRAWVHRRVHGTRVEISGAGQRILWSDALLERCSITLTGAHNRLELGAGARVWDARIRLIGENLVCRIGARCRIRGVNLVVEDRGSQLFIGDGTTMTQPTLVASEGRALRIGRDCMIAYGTDVRNSDGHSLLSGDGVTRLNPAADVIIGDHVWLGINSQILKGVRIGAGAVVATRSLVRQDVPPRVVVGGVPARVLREDVTWDRRRL